MLQVSAELLSDEDCPASNPRFCCCLQAQLQEVYSEVQRTATAELSMCEVRHGHYMGYTVMEDRLQEANQSEEPWSLKVGPDCTPHQPAQLVRCLLYTKFCRPAAVPAH